MANDFGYGGGYNAPAGGFTGGVQGPAPQQQQPDLMAIVNWIRQHVPNMPNPTQMAMNAGRASGQAMQRGMGGAPSMPPALGGPLVPGGNNPQLMQAMQANMQQPGQSAGSDFTPSLPPSPFARMGQQMQAAPNAGGRGASAFDIRAMAKPKSAPKASPLASAIAPPPAPSPAPMPPEDNEAADSVPDDSLAVMPTPALPTTQNSNVLMGNNPMGMAPGLSGQPGMTNAPQGGGDLMSLISRLLHMHGH